jgi:hypothetical protein
MKCIACEEEFSFVDRDGYCAQCAEYFDEQEQIRGYYEDLAREEDKVCMELDQEE